MESLSMLSGLGLAASSFLTIKLACFLFLYTRPSSLDKYRYGKEPWAFVTGASDGIGYALAQELAANSFNVVIHGRNSAKLENCRSQLAKDYPALSFRVVVADASTSSNGEIQDIVDSLSNLNLTVLVNNVGGGSICKPLNEHTPQEVDALMDLNARFPIQLTRALLPGFIEKSGPTLIITIGSLGADFGVPYAVPYGSSKSFNMCMSACLDIEMRSEGHRIEALGIPVGNVTDVAHKKDPATFFTPDARTMARATLARVGCGKAIAIGYAGHAVQKFWLGLLPNAVVESFIVPNMKRYRETTAIRRDVTLKMDIDAASEDAGMFCGLQSGT
ncbi:hypothetical protein ACLMJK_001613 [Lecanora helva]